MKKIMFNDKYGLTKAVLEGRKTQTRRILNPTMLFQRLKTYEGWSNEEGRAWKRSCNRRLYEAQGDMLQQMLDYALSHSHYKVGEVVAIAQSYKNAGIAHDGCFLGKWNRNPDGSYGAEPIKGWSNKMFVRADLMPHRIKITNIRVERLQDINDEDCLKEGIKERYFTASLVGYYLDTRLYSSYFYTTPREAFAALIDKVSGKGTWDSNPYVFVYDFELIK